MVKCIHNSKDSLEKGMKTTDKMSIKFDCKIRFYFCYMKLISFLCQIGLISLCYLLSCYLVRNHNHHSSFVKIRTFEHHPSSEYLHPSLKHNTHDIQLSLLSHNSCTTLTLLTRDHPSIHVFAANKSSLHSGIRKYCFSQKTVFIIFFEIF